MREVRDSRCSDCGIDSDSEGSVQLKCGGTRWCTGGEVKGKLANGVGNQYSSHYLWTWCIQHYYCWCATSAASSQLNWRPRRFKWIRPFGRKKKCGVCARAFIIQLQSNCPLDIRPSCVVHVTTWMHGVISKKCFFETENLSKSRIRSVYDYSSKVV